ncbi:MAG: sensor domain-containing diguanylate cyclase [Spirochaetales bacterium]|nr:sensor domain-containing diguanylate cyclase [Spirochaetales bacterium]
MCQVLDVLSMGIVSIDEKYRISEWNRWMEIHSRKKREDVVGTSLFTLYPHLSTPQFIRSCKSVLKFGNFVFFSQKLHNYLFPFQATGIYGDYFEFMQQSCTLTPVKEDGKTFRIVITIQDVTESVYMERKLKTLIQQDSLTGIHNRRYLDKRLNEEFLRFKRHGNLFSLLIFDIDDFKKINDTYGHQFGDRILINLSGLCSTMIRGSDILARFGGEEFCIILANSVADGARTFAERLRSSVEEQKTRFDDKTDVGITISIGIAEISDSLESMEELVHRADDAMYEAKRQGKNRLCFYEGKV